MKQLPDRDWFTAVGLCVVLEVSTATFSRMLADGRFPQSEAKRGQQHLWSFATVGSYCIDQLTAEQQRLFDLMDGIETLQDRRTKRAAGAALAIKHENELSLRRKMLEADTLEDTAWMASGVYGDRPLREWLRTFPYVYPDDLGPETQIAEGRLEKLRKALTLWRSGNR